MSHFAQIDENNVVQQVLVIDQAEIDTGNWGDPATWIQTSYNTRGGVYYTPNARTPDPDQSKAFRKNYAGIGFTWDGVGFIPQKPYASWVLDPFSYTWSAPVPMPEDGKYYEWDESTVSWVEPTTPSPFGGGISGDIPVTGV
jgi:hypothetical protein